MAMQGLDWSWHMPVTLAWQRFAALAARSTAHRKTVRCRPPSPSRGGGDRAHQEISGPRIKLWTPREPDPGGAREHGPRELGGREDHLRVGNHVTPDW